MATDAMEVEVIPQAQPHSSLGNHRTPHELLEETRIAMEEVASRILAVKRAGSRKSELRDLITQMSLLMISLRQANRAILVEEERVKSETEAAKAPVGTVALQLHNLLYEKDHYVKAIKACKDFRSRYPDIDLVPEEDFFRDSPEEIKGKSFAADPAHDLMLRRLHFELFQRKELCKVHKELEQRKSSLLETIGNQRKFLSSLPVHLKSLKKASLPLQESLGILHSKKLDLYRMAELLPLPLYIAFSQLLAQKEAFGERIEMEIVGSATDARDFAHHRASLENVNSQTDEDDFDEEEEERRTRSKKRLVQKPAKPTGIDQAHPLKLILHIYDDDGSDINPPELAWLKFEYLINIRVVCVEYSDVQGPKNDILCNLFPNDTGLELPHETAKVSAAAPVNFDQRSSRPYKWAQHLAGIDLLPDVPFLGFEWGSGKSHADISTGLKLYRKQNRVGTILQRIRSRNRAQTALSKHLSSLSKLEWPSLMYDSTPWGSHAPVCSLDGWSAAQQAFGSSCPDAGVVSESGVSAPAPRSDSERRSAMPWEVEGAREDGELPTANEPKNQDIMLSNESLEVPGHSISFSSVSKIVTPKKATMKSFPRYEDDPELMVYSEDEHEEPPCDDAEPETSFCDGTWEDHASEEFILVLAKRNGTDQVVKLEAKVKISMEYPLRPPLFRLFLPADCPGKSRWFNVLRAMESEVNLHILGAIPLAHENEILAHQVRCLAMLFDLYFDESLSERKTAGWAIDVGLGQPVMGTMLARLVRGRDRRKTLLWDGNALSSSTR